MPRDRGADPVAAFQDVENELSREGLVVFLTEFLVPLRKVVAGVNLEVLERLDELRGVLTTPEAGSLDADLEEVDALIIRLDKTIRHDAGGAESLRHLHHF